VAKFKEKLLSRKMRLKGSSIGDISKLLKVSKSSVSLWCNDIYISELQKKKLFLDKLGLIKKGSLKANENRKRERLDRLNYYNSIGIKRIGILSKRELFLIGAALYWAEGGKTQRKVVFINSDPKMILLWIKWLNKCLRIPKDRLICRLEINERYKELIIEIEDYWSKLIKIPLSQFRKASLKHNISKKIYNIDSKYYGSLQITIRKSTNLNYEILGYIKGLSRFLYS
jgi:hypothetical protein